MTIEHLNKAGTLVDGCYVRVAGMLTALTALQVESQISWERDSLHYTLGNLNKALVNLGDLKDRLEAELNATSKKI